MSIQAADREHLVRLAFVLLDADGIDREHQLSRAHQLCRKAASRGKTRKATDPYTAARDWLVRRIVVSEPRPQAARLSWRTRMEPPEPRGDAETLRTALRQLSRLDYICYVLLVLEGMAADDVPAYLAALWHERQQKNRSSVAPTPIRSIEMIDAIRREKLGDVDAVLPTVTAATGLRDDRQRELLSGPDFDPSAAHASSRTRKRDLAPWHTRRARRATASTTAIALVAVAVFTGVQLTVAGIRQDVPYYEVVAEDEWRGHLDPEPDAGWQTEYRWTFEEWPTTGVTRNKELIARAVTAWERRGADSGIDLVGNLDAHWWPTVGRQAQILFAGTLSDTQIVLMTLPYKTTIARYVRYRPEDYDDDHDEPMEERLRVISLRGKEHYSPRNGPIHSEILPEQPGPQYLTSNDTGAVWLLVPPWLTELEFSTPFDEVAGWQSVPVNGGIAKIAPEYPDYDASSACQFRKGFSVRATFTATNGYQSKRTWVYHSVAPYLLLATSNYPSPGERMRPIQPDTVTRQLRSFFCEDYREERQFLPPERMVFRPSDGSVTVRYSSPVPPEGVPEDAQLARVRKVVSGDRLYVEVLSSGDAWPVFSNPTIVRLLGADAPKVKTRRYERNVRQGEDGEPLECYGPQAKSKLAELVPAGSRVWVTGSDYGRQPELYVWTDSGALLNHIMIERGYAVVDKEALEYEPKHRDDLMRAESSARASGAGMWSAC